MLSSDDDRVTPETLQLYSTNLEPNSESDFKPLSPLAMNTELESQNFQAIKTSDLKDHLIYMMSQRHGYPGIDEMDSLSEASGEIEQENEKPNPIDNEIPVFRPKNNNKRTSSVLAPVKISQSKTQSKTKSTYQTIMEQDGIYIPKEIKMKTKNVERITNRLERNSADHELFFTQEGVLRNDTPPIRNIPPPFKEEAILPPFHNSDEILMLPATVWGLENSSSARNIRVEVKSIQFTVHHLSSDEDILAIRLKQLHLSYLHALQYPRENYFVTRIKALRKDLKANVDNRAKILEEIVNCHKMRDQEELKTRMKLEQLLVTWHELKDLREKNGYNVTTVTLRWQSKKFDDETKAQEEAQFEKAVNKRAREIVELASLKNEDVDLESTIESIKQQHADMGLRNPGDPIWRPVLEDTTIEATPEESIHDKEEIQRRALMKKARFYAAFMMGTTEMRSDDCVLNENFLVDIDTGCKASVMRIPSDVRIHIYEYGDHKLSEVATVPIPVINGVPKEFINYEFACESKSKSGLINQGYVSARIFVEPDTISTQTIISNDKVIGPTRSAVTNHFLSIPKYLEIVSKHDPNDPYMANAIGSVIAEVNEQNFTNKFAIDPDIDRTKFESMAPSNLCEVIHKKAYDKLYGDKNAQTNNPRLQLADVVRDAPKPTIGNFFSALWRFITFRQSRDTIIDEKQPSHRIESFSKVLLTIKGYSFLPDEVTEVIGKVRFHDQRIETGVYNVGTRLFTRGKFDHNDDEGEKSNTASCLKYEFQLSKSKKKVPHFSQIEDDPIRIDIFDSQGGRYLATISIPLRSVFVNGTISGNYPMFTAPFSLSFIEADETSWVSTDIRSIRIQLSLELTPALLPPEYIDQTTCREKPNIKRRAQMIIDHFAGTRRRIVPLATTTKDQTVLACRFIIPQEPPVHLDRDITSLLAFVSVIPTSPDSALPGAENQRWSTSQQFLNDARGTNTEHAILLCNFLKYMEQDAYVILGHDALAGLCAFVGIRSSHSWSQIFDPTSGREVDFTSSEYSTLLDIGTIFNDRNIWFNQQKQGKEISKINWNLSNTNKWIPFFCKECPRMEFPSPQEEVLEFENSPPEHSEALLRHVETVIKGCTEELRAEMSPKLSTDFDDSFAQRLEKVLAFASNGEYEEVNQSLKKLSRKCKKKRAKMVGTPFFIAYIYDEDNIDKLREEIMNGIRTRREYTSRRKGTKFAAAASITTFPNDMYGIWVLLASVIPHK